MVVTALPLYVDGIVTELTSLIYGPALTEYVPEFVPLEMRVNSRIFFSSYVAVYVAFAVTLAMAGDHPLKIYPSLLGVGADILLTYVPQMY